MSSGRRAVGGLSLLEHSLPLQNTDLAQYINAVQYMDAAQHTILVQSSIRMQSSALIRKATSYTVEFVSRKRPFSTEAQIGLSYTVEKGLFRLNSFRLSFPTGDPVEKLDFFDWICQSKTQSKKFYTCFFQPIASLILPQNTHPHDHTPIPGTTQQYHTTASTLPWPSLLLLLAASQRGALLMLPAQVVVTIVANSL